MADRRTPLARARGLGSAKDGLSHWWVQRLTAIALIPLVVWFCVSLVMMTGSDFQTVRNWIGYPVTMVLLILTIGVGLHHAQLGLQVLDGLGNGRLCQVQCPCGCVDAAVIGHGHEGDELMLLHGKGAREGAGRAPAGAPDRRRAGPVRPLQRAASVGQPGKPINKRWLSA